MKAGNIILYTMISAGAAGFFGYESHKLDAI